MLANGIPLNDAFGGWVYWDKVPQAAIDRIEVQRGSGTDLYGADAVGGVVQILTVRPGRPWPRRPRGRQHGNGPGLALRRQPVERMDTAAAANGSRPGATSRSRSSRTPARASRPNGSESRRNTSGLVTLGYQAGNGWRARRNRQRFDEDATTARRP